MRPVPTQILIPYREILIQTPIKHWTPANRPWQLIHRRLDIRDASLVLALDDRKDNFTRRQDVHGALRRGRQRRRLAVGAQAGEVRVELQLLAGAGVVPLRAERHGEGEADGEDDGLDEAAPVDGAELDEGGGGEVDHEVEECAEEG